MSPRNQTVPLTESQHHVINPANPRGALDDGIEHRLHVRRRAADDAEHLGRRRLMLQRLAQFCVALLDLLEQPHVLDGDHGLSRQRFQAVDLLLGERADLHAADMNRPDGNSLAQQRRGQHRPNAETSREGRSEVVFWHCCQVMNVKGSPVNHGSAGYRATIY